MSVFPVRLGLTTYPDGVSNKQTDLMVKNRPGNRVERVLTKSLNQDAGRNRLGSICSNILILGAGESFCPFREDSGRNVC